MLTCEEVKNLLSAYYDGELGVAAQQQVAEHLASCESCREELKQLKSLSAAFDTLAFPEADKAFRSSLHERLEAEARKNKTFRWSTMWKDMRTYATVAACLVLTIGIYAAVGNHSVQPPVTGPVSSPAAERPTASADADFIPAEPDNTPAGQTDSGDAALAQQTPPGSSAAPKTAQNGTDAAAKREPKQEPAVTAVPDTGYVAEPVPTVSPEQTIAPYTDEPHGAVKEIPAETPAPSGGNSQPPDENMDSNKGGGSPDTLTVDPKANVTTVASFKLQDAALYNQVVELLGSFGTVTESEGQIEAKVLDSNFKACVTALRAMEGVQETGSITKEGDSSGHDYVQVDTKN